MCWTPLYANTDNLNHVIYNRFIFIKYNTLYLQRVCVGFIDRYFNIIAYYLSWPYKRKNT